MAADLEFVKMHGIGNDFIMIDVATSGDRPWADLAQSMCDRYTGVGADGLILATSHNGQLEMRMFNPDGSESEMCGNGVRCFALYARDLGLSNSSIVPVMTGAGLLTLEILPDGRVKVDMGKARLKPSEIGMSVPGDSFINQPVTAGAYSYHGTAVSMGNPHLVIFVDDVAAIDLANVGPAFEHHPAFPARVNVHFVQIDHRGHIIQRTWERGAGITLACGTGACACAVASFLNGHTDRDVRVTLPGGDLEISYQEDGTVFMTGPAVKVFEGQWSADRVPAIAG